MFLFLMAALRSRVGRVCCARVLQVLRCGVEKARGITAAVLLRNAWTSGASAHRAARILCCVHINGLRFMELLPTAHMLAVLAASSRQCSGIRDGCNLGCAAWRRRRRWLRYLLFRFLRAMDIISSSEFAILPAAPPGGHLKHAVPPPPNNAAATSSEHRKQWAPAATLTCGTTYMPAAT